MLLVRRRRISSPAPVKVEKILAVFDPLQLSYKINSTEKLDTPATLLFFFSPPPLPRRKASMRGTLTLSNGGITVRQRRVKGSQTAMENKALPQ